MPPAKSLADRLFDYDSAPDRAERCQALPLCVTEYPEADETWERLLKLQPEMEYGTLDLYAAIVLARAGPVLCAERPDEGAELLQRLAAFVPLFGASSLDRVLL